MKHESKTMKPLRVINVIPSLADVSSGPSYSVLRLCESLREAGIELTVAALDSPSHREMPAWVRRFPRSLGPRRLGRSVSMARWLDAEAAAGNVDLIHNHSLWMMPNIYAGQVACRRRVPYVVSPRGTLSSAAFRSGSAAKRLMWPMLQRPSLRCTACFHATSAAEADDVLAAGFHAPVAVIPNGIDAPAPGRVLGSRRTLLYLGRIHPIKQVDVLLAAWKRLERLSVDWDLRIVGPDNDGFLGEMKRLAGSLGVQRVRFEGELQGDAKLDAYRSADLYVLPTRSENFGMTVAEALVAGTPAVVTDGAPWSGLRSEGAGWWIDQGVDALESALRGAMSTPRSELEAMGLRGRNWMIRDFGWKQIADRMESLYRWILAGSRDDSRPPEIFAAAHGRKEQAR